MNKKLETIEEMASVQQAAKKMKDKNVSSLVVLLPNIVDTPILECNKWI